MNDKKVYTGSREVIVNTGDWSDDGHGKYDTEIVRIFGKNITDRDLDASYHKAVDTVGIDPLKLFAEYEDSSITVDQFIQIQKHGYYPSGATESANSFQIRNINDCPEDKSPVDADGNPLDEYGMYDALELLMWFIGFDIPDFSYELVTNDRPVLVGGGHTIIREHSNTYNSTGYGYGFYI